MTRKILDRNPFWFLGGNVLSMILHNAFFAIFGFEEPVFFLLTLVFAILFIVGAIYKTTKLLEN